MRKSIAIEIRNEEMYELVCTLQPLMREITFEALKNHFFVIGGDDRQLLHASITSFAIAAHCAGVENGPTVTLKTIIHNQ